MIHIDFDPSTLSGEQKAWWDKWQAKAAKATQEIVQAWESSGRVTGSDFRSEIWGELKEWLLENVFHGKCAYCETHIRMSRQSGHAEHFRPKGGVSHREPDSESLKKATTMNEGEQEVEHPGYFWLAYHWRNLLPSCELCNSGGGKRNQFPIRRRYVLVRCLRQEEIDKLHEQPLQSAKRQDICYLQPDDLNDLEQPLLLHPYVDDPREHLCFGDGGIEAPREDENGQPSIRGICSIEVYDLKNDQLRRARHGAQKAALTKFLTAYNNALLNDCSLNECLQEAWRAMTDVEDGKVAYSTAALDFIVLFSQKLAQTTMNTAA
jgi:hypothetical protein